MFYLFCIIVLIDFFLKIFENLVWLVVFFLYEVKWESIYYKNCDVVYDSI